MKNYLLNIFFLLLVSSCSFNNSEIIERNWKYGNGFWIGDFPTFDNSNNSKYKLSNDTIYDSDRAIAIIIGTTRSYVLYDNEIEIKSISTGQLGTYHDFGVREK